MIRKKWLFVLLASILLSAPILARFIRSGFTPPPPGIPRNWKYHKLGEFEVWLPEEWQNIGAFRTIEHRLRDAAGGDESPILFAAFGSKDRCSESIVVESYERAFEIHTPLVGEELATECVRLNPIILTDEAGRNVFPEPSTDIVTIEQDEVALAYQSYMVQQSPDTDFVRTIACAVTGNHVYGIHLDTLEGGDSASKLIYERILSTFRASP
jgi:hypothetical protein